MRWLNPFRRPEQPDPPERPEPLGFIDHELARPVRWLGDRLPWLLLACGASKPGRARSAAAEIGETLARIPPESLIAVDRAVRGTLTWDNPLGLPVWARTPGAVTHLRHRVGDSVPVLCVLAMHPSGYIRQAAVERIDAVGDGGMELPLLILRSYDWVEPVRRSAERAALKRMGAGNRARVMSALPLLLRTEERERRGPVGERAMELLRDPSARPLLRQGLLSADRVTRLACFRWLADDEPELLALVTDALASPDPQLRRAAAVASARLADAELSAVVPRLVADRSARVRTEGVRLARRLGPAGEALLRAAGSDPNGTVRLFARAELKPLGIVTDAAFYRAALDADPSSIGALSGLADVGTVDDAEAFERYVADPRARMRITAAQGIARVRRNEAIPALLRMMDDPSPRVSRAAANELERLPVAAAELAALFNRGASHVRRYAFGLLMRRGKWDSFEWMLRASRDADPRVVEMARGGLVRWIERFNRSYAQPSADQVARIRQALADVGPTIDPLVIDRLRALLPPEMRPAK